MPPFTNQPSLTMVQGLQLPPPRVAASKVAVPGAMENVGRELGKPEGGLGSRRRVIWEGEYGIDHLSLPSKCFVGSVLGSELGL